MAKKVKLAFIGCGGIAWEHLEHGLKDFPDVEFVGWCDLNEKSAEDRREQVGGKGKVFIDAEQMFKQVKPDGVYIMLPPFAHGKVEQLVIKHRLPFFVEKPVAIDLKTAQMVRRGVKKHKLVTAVGYMTRYRNCVQRVKELLGKQKPVMAHGGWLFGGPPVYEGLWKWWVQKDKSGGQFLEMTTHTIDLVRYLFGEVKSVYAVPITGRKKRPNFYTIEDASMVQLTFVNGAAANLYSSCCTSAIGDMPISVSLDVYGTQLKAEFRGWEVAATIHLPEKETVTIPAEPKIFAKEDRAFVDSVKAGRNKGILATYEDGYRATQIAVAANESMKTGKIIEIIL